MNQNFNERTSLRMALESLLDLRKSLRTEFITRDKAISEEIKDILKQVRELDEREGSLSFEENPSELSSTETSQQQEENIKKRKSYTTINYEEVKQRLEEILKANDHPIRFQDIVSILDNNYGLRFSNAYVTINKVANEMHQIQKKKEGRTLYFIWNPNE